MPAIFLSHTSIDKPFVEKLARDLERLGIRVWFDKYEIKVGESILWKIDEGIRESEYLGIVISKEAWESEWVKTEISAAWQKQVQQKGKFVLPIYYRDCEIPLFLKGIKYADFRTNYETGLSDLAKVFGIKELDVITENNWRKFTRSKNSNWKEFRDKEFEQLVTGICKIARLYNFSVWVGGSQNPYSFLISGRHSRELELSITVRMVPSKGYRYLAADTKEWNPNRVNKNDYRIEIGNTVNEVEEYICSRVQQFVNTYGMPVGKISLFTEKKLDFATTLEGIFSVLKKNDWDQEGIGGLMSFGKMYKEKDNGMA